METNTEITLILVAGGVALALIGLFALLFRLFYSSKCRSFSCCFRCIEVKERDTDHEIAVNQITSNVHVPITNPVTGNKEEISISI